jgi:hypothetical protein
VVPPAQAASTSLIEGTVPPIIRLHPRTLVSPHCDST